MSYFFLISIMFFQFQAVSAEGDSAKEESTEESIDDQSLRGISSQPSDIGLPRRPAPMPYQPSDIVLSRPVPMPNRPSDIVLPRRPAPMPNRPSDIVLPRRPAPMPNRPSDIVLSRPVPMPRLPGRSGGLRPVPMPRLPSRSGDLDIDVESPPPTDTAPKPLPLPQVLEDKQESNPPYRLEGCQYLSKEIYKSSRSATRGKKTSECSQDICMAKLKCKYMVINPTSEDFERVSIDYEIDAVCNAYTSFSTGKTDCLPDADDCAHLGQTTMVEVSDDSSPTGEGGAASGRGLAD